VARRALLAGAVLALLLAAARAAYAGERWTFARGQEKATVDVTGMPASARDALLADYEARGWMRTGTEVTADDRQLPAPPPAPPRPAPTEGSERGTSRGAPPEAAPPSAPSVPVEAPKVPSIPVEGLRPLARGLGAVIRSFLEDRADPAREKAWLGLLKDLADALEAPASSGTPEAETGATVGRLFAALANGAGDPARREIARRLLERIVEGQHPKPAEAPPRPPTEGEASDDPLVAGGAHLHLVARAGGGEALVVEAVDPGSVASQVGLQQGDAIVALDGKPVGPRTPARLKQALSRAGEPVLTVERQGGKIEFAVEVVPPARR
jgi:membrane-associated protease RseP (regulator of RpoE activity)